MQLHAVRYVTSIVSNVPDTVRAGTIVDECCGPRYNDSSSIVSNAPNPVCLWGHLLTSAVGSVTRILVHCE